jgi:hypothetical protein
MSSLATSMLVGKLEVGSDSLMEKFISLYLHSIEGKVDDGWVKVKPKIPYYSLFRDHCAFYSDTSFQLLPKNNLGFR